MADLPLAFVGGNPTEGEVGVLVPSSPLRQPIASLLLPDPYMLTGLSSTVTAPHRHHAHPEPEHHSHPIPQPPTTTPLRFLFSGYSLWLELKQNIHNDGDGRGDLSRMVHDAALRFNTLPIPYPHVTALYGIDLEEGEVKRIFREDVKRVLEEMASERRIRCADEKAGLWPELEALGILVDVEYDGVGNGTMDMAWAEVTFATSSEHEALIDALYNLFYKPRNNDNNCMPPRRSLPWAPHLSICYDNPEGFPDNLSRKSITAFIADKAPSLKGAVGDLEPVNFWREVCGISLWSTKGTMSQWKCLDRIDF